MRPDLRRRKRKGTAKGSIESSDAGESSAQRNVRDRQGGFVEQTSREVHPARLRYRNGRNSEVFREEPPEVSVPHTQSHPEVLQPARIVQCAFGDQP
jgi:hypothetical protein